MLLDSVQIQSQARIELLRAEAHQDRLAAALPKPHRSDVGLRTALAAAFYALAVRLDPRLAPRTA
jgi:hypothetical protein